MMAVAHPTARGWLATLAGVVGLGAAVLSRLYLAPATQTPW